MQSASEYSLLVEERGEDTSELSGQGLNALGSAIASVLNDRATITMDAVVIYLLVLFFLFLSLSLSAILSLSLLMTMGQNTEIDNQRTM